MRSVPFFVVLLGALLAARAPGQDQRPNIIYIFSDDHAERAISACGGDLGKTPNIDRIAREGVRFERSFCANSICAPSRATVLTGQHSHVNGKMTNGDRFDPRRARLPQALQEAGYRTAVFGKWHLRCDPIGFDDWDVLPGQGHYYNPDFRRASGRRRVPGHVTEIITEMSRNWLRARASESRPFFLMMQHKAPHRNWMPGPEELGLYRDADLPVPTTLFDEGKNRTVAFGRSEMSIARHLFWHYDLKVPTRYHEGLPGPVMKGRWARGEWDRMTDAQRAAFTEAYREENEALARAQPRWRSLVHWKYQRYVKDYLRCVAGVDRSVGVILDELDRLGIAENTIVVYSSDQGFYLGEHGWYDKRWIFDESMRMPLLMRWPRRIRPGKSVTGLVQNIDHAPTLMAAAGIKKGRRVEQDGAVRYEAMQGRSLWPYLKDQKVFKKARWSDLVPEIFREELEWRDALYYAYHEVGIHAVEPHDGIRTDDAKLVWFPRTREWQYFDLDRDPNELENLVPGLSADGSGDDYDRQQYCRLTRRYVQLRHRYGASPWPLASDLALVYAPDGTPRRRSREVAGWTVHQDERFFLTFWPERGRRFVAAIDRQLETFARLMTGELRRRTKGMEFVFDVEADDELLHVRSLLDDLVRPVDFADGTRRTAAHQAGVLPLHGSRVYGVGQSIADHIMKGLDREERRLLRRAMNAEFGSNELFPEKEFRTLLTDWILDPKGRGKRLGACSKPMREFLGRVAGVKLTQRSR